jgi:hypothetical protein
LLPTVLLAGLCACAGSPAHGQPPPNPQGPGSPPYSPNPAGYPRSPGYPPYSPNPPGGPPVTQPTQQSGVMARPTAPPAGYAPPAVNVNQYAPNYGPYAGVPYYNPTGGGLTGAADAINAQGQFEQQFQQARMMNQDVERSKLDTRRAKIEEWQWERDNTPTLEQTRERDQYWQLRQNLNDPPAAQIWDGTALNTIYNAIKQVLPPDSPGPTMPLPPGVAPQISLTTGVTSTGKGVFKSGPKLRWPLPLQDDAFDELRTDVDKQMKTAYDQVLVGDVEGKVLLKLRKDLNEMDAILKAKIEEMTPTDNIHGKRYVRELRDTLSMLEKTDAHTLFVADRSDQARTVGDLVQGMSARGQKFAPALAGAEPAYNALYTSMVAYYNTLTQPPRR